MTTPIERDKIISIVAKNGWLYETERGFRFYGVPVSQLPSILRDNGWRVSRFWDPENAVLTIFNARYVGGVRPKRFCRVVLGRFFGFNPMLHAFMMEQGATHERIRGHWEDTGDAENGPKLDGYQSHDLYTLDGIHYAASEDGTVEYSQEVPAFDTQGIECDAVTR